MDDHTAFVELLAELTAMGKAPKQDGLMLKKVDRKSHSYAWESRSEYCPAERHDAHNASHVAAEGVLREWCKERGWRGYFIGENDDGAISIEGRAGFAILGTGPTLAVALLDAVRRVRGMKEKT